MVDPHIIKLSRAHQRKQIKFMQRFDLQTAWISSSLRQPLFYADRRQFCDRNCVLRGVYVHGFDFG